MGWMAVMSLVMLVWSGFDNFFLVSRPSNSFFLLEIEYEWLHLLIRRVFL